MDSLTPHIDTIIHGDMMEVLPKLPENSVDSIITDPPYGISFMSKNWDHDVPGIPFWKEALRVAKPGAFLLAFGGTRTHHRLMCAIEDAGWIIRDTMMLFWITGQGFPKSHDISKAADKKAGAEREVVGYSRGVSVENSQGCGGIARGGTGIVQKPCDIPVSTPATDLAKQWDGYGTALKPNYEPIILAMKPLDGTFAHNAEKWGVAGLWIDGSRITTNKPQELYRKPVKANFSKGDGLFQKNTSKIIGTMTDAYKKGRWPSNVLSQHHEECVREGAKKVRAAKGIRGGDSDGHDIYGKGFPRGDNRAVGYAGPDGKETVENWRCHKDCPVRQLDEMSGGRKAGGTRKNLTNKLFGQSIGLQSFESYADKGGASRFFYCGKAPRRERFFLCRDCKAVFPAATRDDHKHGHVDKKGKQTWEHLAYHPTQKPLKLMEYLCRLTKTPTGGIVLDPFAGTGTTLLAAANTGRQFIGIELDPEYIEIARQRLTRNTTPQMVMAI